MQSVGVLRKDDKLRYEKHLRIWGNAISPYCSLALNISNDTEGQKLIDVEGSRNKSASSSFAHDCYL